MAARGPGTGLASTTSSCKLGEIHKAAGFGCWACQQLRAVPQRAGDPRASTHYLPAGGWGAERLSPHRPRSIRRQGCWATGQGTRQAGLPREGTPDRMTEPGKPLAKHSAEGMQGLAKSNCGEPQAQEVFWKAARRKTAFPLPSKTGILH